MDSKQELRFKNCPLGLEIFFQDIVRFCQEDTTSPSDQIRVKILRFRWSTLRHLNKSQAKRILTALAQSGYIQFFNHSIKLTEKALRVMEADI